MHVDASNHLYTGYVGQLHYKEENTKENTNVVPRIQLPFLDPEDYTIELLSKLLSRIMNPQG